MKVRFVREHLLGGGKVGKVGDVVDLPELEARRKVSMGYAENAPEESKQAPPAAPPGGNVRQDDPSARSGDPVARGERK